MLKFIDVTVMFSVAIISILSLSPPRLPHYIKGKTIVLTSYSLYP